MDIWYFVLSVCIIEYKGDIVEFVKSIVFELVSGNILVIFDGKDYDVLNLLFFDNLEFMMGFCVVKCFSVLLFMFIVS